VVASCSSPALSLAALSLDVVAELDAVGVEVVQRLDAVASSSAVVQRLAVQLLAAVLVGDVVAELAELDAVGVEAVAIVPSPSSSSP
jgi:hypothetical protein